MFVFLIKHLILDMFESLERRGLPAIVMTPLKHTDQMLSWKCNRSCTWPHEHNQTHCTKLYIIIINRQTERPVCQQSDVEAVNTWGTVSALRSRSYLGKWDLRCSFRAGIVGSSLRHTWQRRGSFNNSLVPSFTVTPPFVLSISMTSRESMK